MTSLIDLFTIPNMYSFSSINELKLFVLEGNLQFIRRQSGNVINFEKNSLRDCIFIFFFIDNFSRTFFYDADSFPNAPQNEKIT